ncbi:ribosomal RNA small subunit methyltransferase A [Blastopirellula marina]|uniref:Ribosomal RNA small subunit methyltransferase A n=1 Tax=Blastopirellula marina TaxID=124 RepID=A0A2S8F1P5_9BACT|nr:MULTISPECIES: 16S rRNA (adenine(1518)-N(6)/adenine(1519)-N(6))-dimethyltransferase RsmA [Pirellulaceae]PQO26091.1 ribosomal RNA small subunit methyltransferase A [Blastopirellula marina]RCS44449.1 ribosomal RNA small subunit methyltransferase A [Bremerella cremea]
MPEFRNQTISYLTSKFREIGIRPVSKHGQNFLIDMNLLDLLVRSADIQKDDVILEIGTGTGTLSTRMADQAGYLVTVEIDPHMATFATEELDPFENVVLLNYDALRNKNNFRPEMIETIKEKMAEIGTDHFKLAANLPYNVATPIISNLLRTEITPKSMTVTIQKELAERIIATPGTKDYSALSVWIQSQCRCELVRILPPSVFWPAPKVHSAILHIEVEPERRAAIPDLEFFHEFNRSLFFHRRKFLRSVLQSSFKGKLDKAEVDQVMEQGGLDPSARAENFTVDEILAMTELFRHKLAEKDA